MKIAQNSKSWILTPLVSSIIFLLFGLFLNYFVFGYIFLLISLLLLILTGVFLVFFRDPDRKIGEGIVSPADGKIRDISKIEDEDIGKSKVVSIFMNLHNVHVNYMPLGGVVKKITHIKGSYLPAFKKESERNERTIFLFDTKIGLIKVVLIAGTIARRIVSYVSDGDRIKKGQRIGIIRFGSRVDIYIPSKKIKILNVKIGDKVKAGVDSIAELND